MQIVSGLVSVADCSYRQGEISRFARLICENVLILLTIQSFFLKPQQDGGDACGYYLSGQIQTVSFTDKEDKDTSQILSQTTSEFSRANISGRYPAVRS